MLKESFGVNRLGSPGELGLTSFPQANWEKRNIFALQSSRQQPLPSSQEVKDVFESQFPLPLSSMNSVNAFGARFSGETSDAAIASPAKEPEKKAKNKLGFFFGFLQAGVAMTMAPLFFLSTLMGARSKAMQEAGHLAAKQAGRMMGQSGKRGLSPAHWFKNVLERATTATIVPEKSHNRIRRLVNGTTQRLFKHELTDRDIKKMYQYSKVMLTATVFPKALNGMVYGFAAQQPSMIFEHAIELLAFPFALAQTPFIQNALFMLSGLFSLGLANDLDNDKKRAVGSSDLRVYDMSHFKDVFRLTSELSPVQRAKGLVTEGWGMTRFVGEDIKVGLQRVKRDLTLIAHRQPNEILNAEGNGGKASLNFALLQLGTVPKLMLSFIQNENGPVGQAIRLYSSVIQSFAVLAGDISIFMLGKNGQTVGEKIPMVGVTTEAAGRIISYGKKEQPLATFLQKLGEAGNSIFYAVRAAKLEK